MSVVEQLQLPIAPRAVPAQEIPLTLIVRQPTFMAAINLCISASGLDAKQLYLPLGIDQGHWSNILKSKGHFPPDKLENLMDLCGSEIPLIWLAHRRGKEVKPLISEIETQLIAERAARITAENELAVITKFMRETRR